VRVVMPDGSVAQTEYHGLTVRQTNALGQGRRRTLAVSPGYNGNGSLSR
jgi:hypothetical protein